MSNGNDSAAPGNGQDTQQAPQQEFVIHKVYLKDVSFESPNAPDIFTQEWAPETHIDLNTASRAIDENIYEVELSLTVTTKLGERTAYLVEIKQAGVFGAAGFAPDHLGHLLGSYCPNLLFPYAREAISSLVTKGGFPDMALAPVNFDALYAQHLEQLRQQAEQGEEPQPDGAAGEGEMKH